LQAAIANAPLPAEGNGSFSNYHLCALVLLTPAVLLRFVPFVKVSSMSWLVYFVFVALFGVPVTVAYWTVMSAIGPRINDKVELPGREWMGGGTSCRLPLAPPARASS
jgi:K+-transporting ATPase A subunit